MASCVGQSRVLQIRLQFLLLLGITYPFAVSGQVGAVITEILCRHDITSIWWINTRGTGRQPSIQYFIALFPACFFLSTWHTLLTYTVIHF